MSAETPVQTLRLRVTAEPDPGALARVLERFQILNVVPRRVVAEFGLRGEIHIQVDVSGLPELRIEQIAARVAQHPCVLNAFWHRI